MDLLGQLETTAARVRLVGEFRDGLASCLDLGVLEFRGHFEIVVEFVPLGIAAHLLGQTFERALAILQILAHRGFDRAKAGLDLGCVGGPGVLSQLGVRIGQLGREPIEHLAKPVAGLLTPGLLTIGSDRVRRGGHRRLGGRERRGHPWQRGSEPQVLQVGPTGADRQRTVAPAQVDGKSKSQADVRNRHECQIEDHGICSPDKPIYWLMKHIPQKSRGAENAAGAVGSGCAGWNRPTGGTSPKSRVRKGRLISSLWCRRPACLLLGAGETPAPQKPVNLS